MDKFRSEVTQNNYHPYTQIESLNQQNSTLSSHMENIVRTLQNIGEKFTMQTSQQIPTQNTQPLQIDQTQAQTIPIITPISENNPLANQNSLIRDPGSTLTKKVDLLVFDGNNRRVDNEG